jgi:hypothetical protein
MSKEVITSERDWLTATSVIPLRDWIVEQRKKLLRKMRLFGCACCRRFWDHLPDPRSKAAIEASEKFADDEIDRKALGRARLAAASAAHKAPIPPNASGTRWTAEDAAQILCNLGPSDVVVACSARCLFATANLGLRTQAEEEVEQAKLIRDIFGNPFHVVAFRSTWRSDTVVSLAKHMYVSRDFSPMPILADALQDAGCETESILRHCRDEAQPHVRGCWVVDLVLGKV